jgi:hypothetical protein
MFMMAETPTRIPAFYSPEPFAGMQETLWLIVTSQQQQNAILRRYDFNCTTLAFPYIDVFDKVTR